MAKEPSFHFQTVDISGEAAVFADDAVAWDDDRKGIEAIGVAYSPDGIVMIDDICDVCVGPGAAVGDQFDHFPDFDVELRSIAKIQFQIEFLECAGKISGKLVRAVLQTGWDFALFAVGIFRPEADAADAFVRSFNINGADRGWDDRMLYHGSYGIG